MRLLSLPPIRRPVPLARGKPQEGYQSVRRFFGDREVVLFESGTAALAVAIAECRAQREVSNPEVLLPAYGCPDLIAACLHASVWPRLVGPERNTWGYDPGALRETLSSQAVAIVAVNLLGVGDGAVRILSIARGANVLRIQVSASIRPVTVMPGATVMSF